MIEPEISLAVKLDLLFPSHEVVIPAKFTYFIKILIHGHIKEFMC